VQPPDSASRHPVDLLIARLVFEQAEAFSDDVQRIVDRMATAPFSRRLVRVPRLDRGLSHGSLVLGRTADSLLYHFVKRIRGERQWSDDTTVDQYLEDLRTAVQHPQAKLLLYERAADVIAATMSPTYEIVAPKRLGERRLPYLLVVHSARHGTLRTGYMFSRIQELDLPEVIRWLK